MNDNENVGDFIEYFIELLWRAKTKRSFEQDECLHLTHTMLLKPFSSLYAKNRVPPPIILSRNGNQNRRLKISILIWLNIDNHLSNKLKNIQERGKTGFELKVRVRCQFHSEIGRLPSSPRWAHIQFCVLKINSVIRLL